jgi:hypothetical protein
MNKIKVSSIKNSKMLELQKINHERQMGKLEEVYNLAQELFTV